MVIISWLVKDEKEDAIPISNADRIALMEKRAEGFAEPLRSIVTGIPDDLDLTTPLRLADFPCLSWENENSQVTLAGDSCHAMIMFVSNFWHCIIIKLTNCRFRGEGANYGILDAAILVDELKKIHNRSATQKEAIEAYESELNNTNSSGRVEESSSSAGCSPLGLSQ